MRRSLVSTIAAFGVAVAVPVAGASQLLPEFQFAHVHATTIATDPFTNSDSQHATAVEPDTFSFGSTIVVAVQLGRYTDGGSSDLGYATSTDGGSTWTHGTLPGVTKTGGGGTYDRASDPSVAYDAKHGRWLISGLPLIGTTGQVPFVSASSDGKTWANPVKVGTDNGDFMDKPWLACDDTPSSPHYGNCYEEWDDVNLGDQVMMTTSSDGGKTWSPAQQISNGVGLGGQPVVEPNGTAVVPFLYGGGGAIGSFRSTDGGKSWSSAVTIASENDHQVNGGLRSEPLPSARIDGGGTIYVAWQDCSFRSGCNQNDIVYVTSSDGVNWSAKTRVPIDKLSSTVDHFIPGIALDPSTSGKSAHIGLTYYFYPQANCSPTTCALTVGYISSLNGGATWSRPRKLSPPMKTTWLASTDSGYMVGDYISTSFAGAGLGTHAAFAVAKAPTGSKFHEALDTSAAAQPAARDAFEATSFGERPLPGVHSDHAHSRFQTAF